MVIGKGSDYGKPVAANLCPTVGQNLTEHHGKGATRTGPEPTVQMPRRRDFARGLPGEAFAAHGLSSTPIPCRERQLSELTYNVGHGAVIDCHDFAYLAGRRSRSNALGALNAEAAAAAQRARLACQRREHAHRTC